MQGDGKTYKRVDLGGGYLIRYMRQGMNYKIFGRRPPWNVFIHRFCKSDAQDPHDHPFFFFTYIVSGSYQEHTYRPDPNNKGLLKKTVSVRLPGTIAFRKPTDLHSVQLGREDEPLAERDAPLTVCLVWRIPRIWGFVTPLRRWDGTESKVIGHSWINWFDYLGIKPGSSKHEGSE